MHQNASKIVSNNRNKHLRFFIEETYIFYNTSITENILFSVLKPDINVVNVYNKSSQKNDTINRRGVYFLK